jgi:hypothetical protein
LAAEAAALAARAAPLAAAFFMDLALAADLPAARLAERALACCLTFIVLAILYIIEIKKCMPDG